MNGSLKRSNLECNKIQYHSESEAKSKVKISKKGFYSRGRRMNRFHKKGTLNSVYECNICGYWHTTKQKSK